MSTKPNRQGLYPFDDNIVNEPRQIESGVESLNAAALKRVLANFEALQKHPIPRLGNAPNATVVLSPEPGYGKSHLIGRLFKALDDDATLIYVRPYQDAQSCWIALLERIVTELNYPDDAGKIALEPGDLSQLDTLARRVMVHLTMQLLEGGHTNVRDPQSALEFFKRFPNAVFETQKWRDWLHSNFEDLLPALDRMLAARGIQMLPNCTSWIRVLAKYAFSEDDANLRQTCLEWIKYEPLAPEDGKALGLRLAELPDMTLPYEQRNERCFQRVRELLQIAAFYRPFLLCFDQTELYGSSEELARTLGVVLSRLRREAKNHLCVVTGNEAVWENRLLARFEKADQDTLSPPIHLEGIVAAQAKELLASRLEAWHVNEGEQKVFLGEWIDQLFANKRRLSVRHVLREASARWNNGEVRSPATPKSLFDAYRKRLLADPKRLDFDPGVFQLVCQTVLGPAVQATVTPLTGSSRRYVSMEWKRDERDVLLGFEPGSHWRTWEAIVREAKRFQEARRKEGRPVHTSFFRTDSQKRLPARSAKDITKSECVRLVELPLAEAAAIYAAHDLYADVQQGNQDIDGDALLAFLREELMPYALRVLEGARRQAGGEGPGSGSTTPGLVADIRDAVAAVKLATMEVLLARLAVKHSDLTPEQVLEACRSITSIRIMSSPNNVVFRWTQSA